MQDHTQRKSKLVAGTGQDETFDFSRLGNIIDGGDGFDVLDYALLRRGLRLSLVPAGDLPGHTTGSLDYAANVELVAGSSKPDIVWALDSGRIAPLGQPDVIFSAGDGDDTLLAGDGDYGFAGGQGRDVLQVLYAENDAALYAQFIGEAGADVIDVSDFTPGKPNVSLTILLDTAPDDRVIVNGKTLDFALSLEDGSWQTLASDERIFVQVEGDLTFIYRPARSVLLIAEHLVSFDTFESGTGGLEIVLRDFQPGDGGISVPDDPGVLLTGTPALLISEDWSF